IEYTCRFYSIFPKSLIEISHPEQQQSIRIFILDGIVLLHQWGGFFGFSGCQDLEILIPANVLIPVFYLQYKIRLLSKIIHRLYIAPNQDLNFFSNNFFEKTEAIASETIFCSGSFQRIETSYHPVLSPRFHATAPSHLSRSHIAYSRWGTSRIYHQ